MDEGMYYEGETESPEAEDSGEMEEPSGSGTALLPKSFLSGKTPGDTVTLKIVKVWDDEIEVAPADSAQKRLTADEEIDQMAYGRTG